MSLAPGDRVGPYEIVEAIGAGGMGQVFRARDIRLNRDIALKTLSPAAVADPTRRERFVREARAASALEHPHIAVIHEIGEADGVTFIAMELVRGEPLGEIVTRGPIAPARALDLAIETAEALARAHEIGILHRDLKPANIMVTFEGHAKIIDFGIAKLLDRSSSEAETMTPGAAATEAGAVIGTAAYMSPEQARGAPVDQRTDVFSLGTTFYEMLAGRPPFSRRSTVETMNAIIHDPLPSLPASLGSGVDDLRRILDKCLAKEPDDRYQGMRDLVVDLRAARRRLDSPEGAATRSHGPQRRRRMLRLIAVAGVVVAAAVIFLVARRHSPAPAPHKRIAVLPFENLGAPEDAYFADGVTDEVRGKLAALRGLDVIARASSDQYKGTRKAPHDIAQELGVGYLLTGTIRWQKSGATSRVRLSPELVDVSDAAAPVTLWRQAYDENLSDVFDVQARIATEVAGALEITLGAQTKQLEGRPTSSFEAYDAYLKGVEIFSRGFTPEVNRDAAAQFQRAVDLDPQFALAWAYLSLSQSLRYEGGTTTPAISESAGAAAQRAAAIAPELPKAIMARGIYERAVHHDPVRAAEVFLRGLDIAPDNVDLIRNLGYAYWESGKGEEALALNRRALALDPKNWQSQLAVSSAALYLRRLDEARDAADRALALAPNITALENTVFADLGAGDVTSARAAIATPRAGFDVTAFVIDIASQGYAWILSADERDLLRRLDTSAIDNARSLHAVSIADSYWAEGQSREARQFASQAELQARNEIGRSPDDYEPHMVRGYSLAILGRNKEAADENALALRLVKNLLSRLTVLAWSSWAYAADGDSDRAIDMVEQVLAAPGYITPAYLRIDPHYASLRGRPRFEQLLRH